MRAAPGFDAGGCVAGAAGAHSGLVRRAAGARTDHGKEPIMANTLPTTIDGQIDFFTQRLADWAANAAAIGLSPAQVASLQAVLTPAINARNTVLATRQLGRNQTAVQNAALDSLLELGTGLIATIKAFADLSANPALVYEQAGITPPEPRPSPLPPPVPATDLATQLLNSGAVRVTWKGTVASGTFYDVYRQLEGEQGFTLIGSSASRRFDDAAVPAGTPRAIYYTVTRRDTLSSDQSEPVLIRFGVVIPGPGAQQSSGQSGGGLSLAA